MASKLQIEPLNPSKSVVDTVLHGNNNFVSTLDHLPCELTRSLWFIQMMNLRNTRNEAKLKLEYLKPENDRNYQTIRRLQKLLLRNSEELVEESKYLISFLSDHLELLSDDLNIIRDLKDKLPGWTSEAVERRWNEWGQFKLEYLQRVKDRKQNKYDKCVEEFAKTVVSKQTSRTVQQPKLSSDLKIKINLKNIKLKTGLKKQTVKPKKEPKQDLKLPLIHIPSVSKAKELVDQQTTQLVTEKPVEERYCFCNGPSFGRMVACEYDKCPHEWFHFKCVGLTSEPKGNWFCSDTCRDKYDAAQLRKKQRKKRRW